MEGKAKELAGLLSEECTTIADVQVLLKGLFKETIEQMLQAEMDEHLGYEKRPCREQQRKQPQWVWKKDDQIRAWGDRNHGSSGSERGI